MLLKDPAYGGKYCSFTPGHANYVDEAEYQALVDAHIAFKDMSADSYLLSAGIASDWPHGRCAAAVSFQYPLWHNSAWRDNARCIRAAGCLPQGCVHLGG